MELFMKLATFALTFLIALITACAAPPPEDSSNDGTATATTAGSTETTGTGGTSTTPECAAGQTLCGTACTDTLVDSANCGACGQACMPGMTCSAGSCVCSAPLSDCSGQCVNVNEDVLHCGGCGMACGAQQGCVTGACSCPAGYTGCGEQCSDLQTDINNCGACGTACAATQGCAAGACACPAGYTSCGEACIDTTKDLNNCGGCDLACTSGQGCSAGACACLAGLTDCAGACLSTDENADNCGACGTVCGAGEVCSLGACSTQCAEGLTLCEAARACANLETSVAHCGACDNACPAGQVCEAGACSCADGLTACDGVCVDTQANLENCGGCGVVCTGGSTCVEGSCSCPDGQELCDGVCVDTQANLNNCGACGYACAGGASCAEGQCTCPDDQLFCDGQCRDVTSNVLHCGACNNACVGGDCVDGTCPTVKDCAVKTVITEPQVTDFEDYDGTTAADEWGFSFNTEDDPVYGGSYEYNDDTGAASIQMVTGHDSDYAVNVQNAEASAWGGALGFWMSCIDASGYDGISFWARGPVPRGLAVLSLSMEETTPPSEDDPAGGGTCTSEDCAGPSFEFEVTDQWSRVLLPWADFEPGTTGTASIPATGTNITGMTISLNLNWVPDPAGGEDYVPEPDGYDLAVDDIQFFDVDGSCPSGQEICGGACTDPLTDPDHCGSCDAPCEEGQECNAGSCECPSGTTWCVDACVDTQTNVTHCGACGKVCPIGGTCSGGQCQGGAGDTSSRCGFQTTLLGNPFGCEFGWGANDNGSFPNYVDFVSKWVGYEQNIDSQCDGCGWLNTVVSNGSVPLYIAYFIAYRANIDAGYGDCNTDNDGQNLCTGGAQWIRDNRQRIIDIYGSYAARSYQSYSSGPVIWVVEPDFVQYEESTQSNPLSMTELGSLATDIICAIRSNMPTAVVAVNYSPWIQEPDVTNFWTAMPLDLIDFVHVTGMGNVDGGYINDGDAYDRQEGTYSFLSGITGRKILVDTSFGVTTMDNTWSSIPASTLNERIADGVAGALVFPTPGSYQSQISGLSSQLNSTCN